MEDVVKNATTESIKLISGQNITGELTMKLKTLLHNCLVSDIDIIIAYHDADNTIKYMDIEIRNRKDFYKFIATYGNSVVNDWGITNGNGIAYLHLFLKNLVIVKDEKPTIKPTTKEELINLIYHKINEKGLNCNLNFIDVSNVEDMSWLFERSKFNGNISKWDVSKVKNMEGMFANSNFNQDISMWDVSKVENMREMFYKSKFNQDISKWDVSNVKDMDYMFENCPLEENPPDWY